jgi:hypothetical protein
VAVVRIECGRGLGIFYDETAKGRLSQESDESERACCCQSLGFLVSAEEGLVIDGSCDVATRLWRCMAGALWDAISSSSGVSQ